MGRTSGESRSRVRGKGGGWKGGSAEEETKGWKGSNTRLEAKEKQDGHQECECEENKGREATEPDNRRGTRDQRRRRKDKGK